MAATFAPRFPHIDRSMVSLPACPLASPLTPRSEQLLSYGQRVGVHCVRDHCALAVFLRGLHDPEHHSPQLWVRELL